MTAASTRLAGISPMTQEYAEQVLDIYRRGIASGHATFETEPPTWDTFTATRLADHRLVATDPCSPESGRCGYAGVVEHSVYVHPDAGGKGVGRHHGVWRDVVLIERRSPTVG
jgi:L-amino acid N-acyltransferase YncA